MKQFILIVVSIMMMSNVCMAQVKNSGQRQATNTFTYRQWAVTDSRGTLNYNVSTFNQNNVRNNSFTSNHQYGTVNITGTRDGKHYYERQGWNEFNQKQRMQLMTKSDPNGQTNEYNHGTSYSTAQPNQSSWIRQSDSWTNRATLYDHYEQQTGRGEYGVNRATAITSSQSDGRVIYQNQRELYSTRGNTASTTRNYANF